MYHSSVNPNPAILNPNSAWANHNPVLPRPHFRIPHNAHHTSHNGDFTTLAVHLQGFILHRTAARFYTVASLLSSICRRRKAKMATNAEGGRTFARRDQLLKIQSQIQKFWDEENIFETTSLSKPPEQGDASI
ncbi:hypothetical protein KSP40_PGU002526 [Platanthera guangdongensis]|uniref:Uncharacterized protein n=1 Tax=Platanthera guangdongensis TaxID=2320717 RepID=A0ABR2LEC5_9ASPA